MRSARLYGAGDVRLVREPEPVPAAGESLVRVEAVGLCGSDLHWFDQGGIGDATVGDPVVPGHEIAGTALTGPHAGRLVAVDPAVPCGRCRECLASDRNLCTRVRFAGHGTHDGGMREVMAWPTALLHPLPAGLTAADGACLEPLGVALHAVDLAHLRVGATVGVVGAGPIGLLLTRLVRVAGAARVLMVGIPDDDTTTYPAGLARRKGVSLVMVRRMKEMYERTTALVADGLVDVHGLVTAVHPLAEAPTAFAQAAERRGLKVVVDPSA